MENGSKSGRVNQWIRFEIMIAVLKRGERLASGVDKKYIC